MHLQTAIHEIQVRTVPAVPLRGTTLSLIGRRARSPLVTTQAQTRPLGDRWGARVRQSPFRYHCSPGSCSKFRPLGTFHSPGGCRNARPSGWTAPIPCGILRMGGFKSLSRLPERLHVTCHRAKTCASLGSSVLSGGSVLSEGRVRLFAAATRAYDPRFRFGKCLLIASNSRLAISCIPSGPTAA